MPRHPLPPPVVQRRVLTLGLVGLLALPVALWKTNQKRRQLIRQELAWKVPFTGDFRGGLAISPDGKRLTCWFPEERIHFKEWQRSFDTRTGDVVENRPAPSPMPFDAEFPFFKTKKNEVIRRNVRVWLPPSDFAAHLRLNRSGKTRILSQLPAFPHWPSVLRELRLSPDARVLTVLRSDGVWRLDVLNGRVLSVVRPKGGRKTWGETFENCTLSPDGTRLITLAPRPTLYDARSGGKIRSFGEPLEMQCGGCGCIEPDTGFSPDGRVMWVREDQSGGNNSFWRVSDGKRLWSHQFLEWQFSPNGRFVFCSDQGQAHLFNAATGQMRPLSVLAPVERFLFSPDSRFLYTLGQNSRIQRHSLSKYVSRTRAQHPL